MKGIYVISLISFYLLALCVNDNGITKSHSVKDYLRGFFALKQITNLRHGILPGTFWCGLGNISRDNSELGMYTEMDDCCRTHDYCEDSIESRTTRYGLYNKYICRSSLCECELQFHNCLIQIRGFYPYSVRRLYFSKCRQCFRTFYDPQKCVNEGLDLIEEMDRKDRRVFCAKFYQNPKWHNITIPKSTWDNNPILISRFYSEDDKKYSTDEDDTIYDENYFHQRFHSLFEDNN